MLKKKSFIIPGLLISLFGASPFIWTCFYVYPQNDDFAYANWTSFLSFQEEIYQKVGGRFFCSGIASLSPLHWKSFIGYQLFLAATLIVFCTTAFYVSRFLFSRFLFNSNLHSTIVSILLVIICLSGMPMLKEAFFWHSGTAAYSIPFICFLWGIFLLIKWHHEWYRWQIIIIAAFAFFSIGGNELYLLTCWAIVAITSICFWKDARSRLHTLLPLLFAMAMATILVLAAPGNSIRVSNEMVPDSSLLQALRLAFIAYWYSVKGVFVNQAFWLITIFIVHLTLTNRINKVFSKPKIIALCLANLALVFLCLPATAIYQTLPVPRYMNIIYCLTAVLMIVNLWVLLTLTSRIMNRKMNFLFPYQNKIGGIFTTLCMILFIHYAPWQFNNYTQLYQDVKLGKLKGFKNEWENRIKIANESETDTIMLPEISTKPQILFLYDLDTIGGNKYLINKSMAKFWGKTAVLPLNPSTIINP